jgi:Fe-S-cluster containining protein
MYNNNQNINNSYSKQLKKLTRMSRKKVFFEILSFYDCPEFCKGSCCKHFDISYSTTDIKRISHSNKKYKSILENLVNHPNPTVINGKTGDIYKLYPTKPCPFLTSDTSKCKIQNIKPGCCKFYPFGVKEDKSRTHPGYPVMITLDRCYLGVDILIDFMVYNINLSKISKDISFDFEEYYAVFFKEILDDKTKVTELYTSEFFEFNQFIGFLFFLKNTTIDLKSKREEFKQLVLDDKMQRLRAGIKV